MTTSCFWSPLPHVIIPNRQLQSPTSIHHHHLLQLRQHSRTLRGRIFCYSEEQTNKPTGKENTGIQLYGEIERLITETAKRSQYGSTPSQDWYETEGAWVLRPRNTNPTSVVHFIGGIFVGAAPQLTYRLFLERLSEKGVLVIATPYASGFDHFLIADEAQFKFDRCLRSLQPEDRDLPTFGIGHSLGSLVHLLIGSRYAIQRSGNVLMSFNNKEASVAIPLFSPVLVPMAQNFGPVISQLISSPTVRFGAEMAKKQFENLSPPLMKQVLPLVEQLPPLYMDLAKGREDFTPKPEETRRIVKSYYGISKNLLVKFKDDMIDETPILAQVLSSEAAISSLLDMSVRSLPGDHGCPLQQVIPDVPPGMTDAVNRGGEILASLTMGTPWEAVGKEVGRERLRSVAPLIELDPWQPTFRHVQSCLHQSGRAQWNATDRARSVALLSEVNSEVGSTLSMDGKSRGQVAKDVDLLVDVITSWMGSTSGSNLLRP